MGVATGGTGSTGIKPPGLSSVAGAAAQAENLVVKVHQCVGAHGPRGWATGQQHSSQGWVRM